MLGAVASSKYPTYSIMVGVGMSRFHPASIAGLVVGAWGIFIFAAAFLHWRRRRRLHEEQDAQAA